MTAANAWLSCIWEYKVLMKNCLKMPKLPVKVYEGFQNEIWFLSYRNDSIKENEFLENTGKQI